MPIEIRELIIKTEISTTDRNSGAGVRGKEISMLKKQLLDECKRIIAEKVKRNSYKR